MGESFQKDTRLPALGSRLRSADNGYHEIRIEVSKTSVEKQDEATKSNAGHII